MLAWRAMNNPVGGPPPSIPASIEEIDVAWLRGVMSGAEGLDPSRLRGFDKELVGVGRGFTTQLARLTLDWEDAPEAPASVVVKLHSPDALTRDMTKVAYEREQMFYERFVGRTPLSTPRCYHAAYDADAPRFVLVLEDLGQLEPGDQIEGTSDARAETVIRDLARLHASFWNDEEVRALGIIEEEGEVADILDFYRAGLDDLQAKHRERLPMIVLVAETIWELVSAPGFDATPPALKPPFTLLHGDYRLDNMFFCSDDSVVVFDWIIRAGGGGLDLGYFLYWSLTTEQLKSRGPALMKLYHRTLVENGVSDYSMGKLKRDCRLMLVGLAIQMVIAQVLIERRRVGVAPETAAERSAFEERLEGFFANILATERGELLMENMTDRVEGALRTQTGARLILGAARSALRLRNRYLRWRA